MKGWKKFMLGMFFGMVAAAVALWLYIIRWDEWR